jgi:hypothetical protein
MCPIAPACDIGIRTAADAATHGDVDVLAFGRDQVASARDLGVLDNHGLSPCGRLHATD